MALVGTISGSNGTSNTAVTGGLVIANVSVGFPQLPSDAVLFVSGVIGGGSKAVIGGDVIVSGSLAVPTGSIYSLTSSHVFASGSIFNSGSVGYSFGNKLANFNFTTESFIGVDTSLGAYTGTLPVISGDYIGRMYVIKDVGGLCGTTAFVITASTPNKIDGATELKVNATSGSVSLIAGISGSSYNWYIVGSN